MLEVEVARETEEVVVDVWVRDDVEEDEDEGDEEDDIGVEGLKKA